MTEDSDGDWLVPIPKLDPSIMKSLDVRLGKGTYYVVVAQRDSTNRVYAFELNDVPGGVSFGELLPAGTEDRPDLRLEAATIVQGQYITLLSNGVKESWSVLVVKTVRSSTQISNRDLFVERFGTEAQLRFNS